MGEHMKFKSVKPFLSDEGLFGIKPYNIDWAITDNWKSAKNKVLVVVEFVPSIDLKEKSLMGHTLSQQTYSNLFDYTFSEVKKLNSKVKQSDWGFMFVNFNHFKWFDLSPQQKDVCIGAATKRMRRIIKKIPHTHLLLMGDTVAAKILDDPDANTKRLWVHDYKGTPTVNTIGIDRSFSASKSDDDDLDDDAIDQANILGYASRCIQNLILGYNPYRIDVKPRAKLIKTIKEFDALYKELKKAKRIAVDTEGTSLETIENKLATIQFATSSDIGYVIPWYHQDSTWSVSEFKYLRKKLRKLFTSNGTEYKGTKTKFLIGQNFGYDIRVLSKELNIRYWSHNTWDLMAGEFLLDENIKVLRTYGTSAYSLAQICMNYGCDFYYTATFSKAQRTLIAHQELTQEVLDYTTMDVQVMIAIQEQQMKRASNILHVDDKPYTKDYHRLMLTQLSSMIRVMSIMKYRGNTIDIEYLLSLLRPDSPISSKIDELTKEFYELPEVKKASKLLNEDKGAPSGGLFGQSFSSFNLSKKAHLQTLFIDVLDLEPLRYGKKGDPSFDKMFLKTYEEDNRSVAIINDLNKLGKLKSSYIDAFYGHVEESHDGRIDKRLRPDFGYTGVVTGRSNSSKPSFQQIPEHSADAKIIKRMFISPPMVLPFEADYSAHEVRCLNLNNFVITSKGLKRLSEIIAINDDSYLVLSHNHKTGKDEYKRIGYKSAHTTEFDHLEIVHEHGMVACTANHQIWSITRNAYVYADQLQVGEELLTNDYLSRPTKIVCIENYGKQSHLVGDIGIFDNHNLYVQATDEPLEKPVLVHNCWGIAADDDVVRQSFLNIHNLIIKYRHDPTEKNLKRKETEGDPHKQNYHMFTGVPLDKITKEQRQDAKQITFGSLYGKGDNALARDTNKSVEEAREIKKSFFKKFHRGEAWLKRMVTYAQEHLFAVSPIGRRRNLFGNLSGHNAMRAAVQRRAQNSPIQGFASDICFMAADIYARTIHELFDELGIKHKSSKVGTSKTDITYLPTGPNVMVHDSIKAEMPIEYYLLGMHILEWSMTHGVTQYLRETHGVITGVPFDIEFSVGADWSHKDDWDFSANHMEKAIKQTLLDHKALYPDNAKVQAIDPDKTYAYMVDCYHEQCKQLKLRERFPLNID